MRRVINIVFTILLSIGIVLLGVFVFRSSYIRLLESFRDFGLSIAYYFCEIADIEHNIKPTVLNPIPVTQTPSTLPEDFESFKQGADSYFKTLFSKGNFFCWLGHISGVIEVLAKALVIVVPIIVLFIVIIRAVYASENNKWGKDTVPLKIFKFISRFTYQPLKRFVRGYVAFIRSHGWIWKLWLAVIGLHFNLGTIVVEFLAYYFYFAATYDFDTLYGQFVKLFQDLKTPFIYFPYWLLIPLAIILFNRWRRRMALSRLRHYEARNCGFINELPIVSLTCGSMGKKKTTMITDMVLSQEVMFRQRALEILQSNDMKFPFFPWICFEKELQACILHGTVYNLASVKDWVHLKRERFARHGNTHLQLYGYDICRYGHAYNDALKASDLFYVLETYAQAYYIYVVTSSLIVSNYSIRTDNRMIDSGNLPVWLTDFFSERESDRHSHVIDFDILRLGKKLIEGNPNAGSFEFGVVAITEIGKERGNMLELKEMKKNDDEANQKNDLFNSWLKMCRHSATVDNFPFIKVFCDEQRPESWGADARDLCDIVTILKSGEQRLAYPLYTIEDMLSEWAFNRFMGLYMDFRFRRGDNTLLVHILKNITVWIWRRNIRVYNRYGYSTLSVATERGTQDGKKSKKKYFLMNGKIYRNRFCTDCFSDFFNDMARQAHCGLNDYREYATEKASVEELLDQNSYFVNSLYGGN